MKKAMVTIVMALSLFIFVAGNAYCNQKTSVVEVKEKSITNKHLSFTYCPDRPGSPWEPGSPCDPWTPYEPDRPY